MTNLQNFYKGLLALSLLCISSISAGFKFASSNAGIKLTNSGSQLKLEAPITNYNGILRIEAKNNDSIQGASGSDTISFSNGTISYGQNNIVFNGIYDPTAADTITLSNNQILDISNGNVQGISVTGTVGNESVIKGQPTLTGEIVFGGDTNYLKIGIQSKLTQNISLNGGNLILIDDLRLQDGVKLDGNGTVDLGNFTLSLASSLGSSWTGNLTFKNAQDIQLNGYTVLNGQWTFDDIGGTSFLNGNGNVLDISGGGTLAVASGHTLYMSDIHIKGLGSGLGDFAINATGIIKMSNVTIEMGANYTLDAGTLYVLGDNCKLIAGGTSGSNYTFTVNGDGVITVDHAVLLYEVLGGTNSSPFSFEPGTQNLINGGVIRSSQLDISSFALLSDIPQVLEDQTFDVTTPSPTLTYNSHLTANTRILVTNSLSGAQSMTLNGDGFFVQFPATQSSYFSIANDVALRLTRIVLKDFNSDAIDFGTNSTVAFGNGTIIELNDDVTIGDARPWAFSGNCTLDGCGHTIRLDGTNYNLLSQSTEEGPITLKIRNAKLIINNAQALECLDSAIIELEDVNLCVECSEYTFTTGSLNVKGHVCIRGTDAITPGGIPTFTFASDRLLTVEKASILEVRGDVNFKYQATPLWSDELAATKRHLVLNDPSATLHLNGCVFTSTNTGIALDYGNLIVEDNVTFAISTADAAEAEFGSALDVCIKAGATLEVGGPLKYVTTSYVP